MDTLQQALPALNYRITQLEQKLEARPTSELEAKLAQLERTMANLRAEIMAGRQALSEGNMDKQKNVLTAMLDESDILVPKELRIRNTGRGRPGGGNRQAKILAKRWALWKIQREQGFTFQEIARAWGCNHTSVCHAASKDWKPYGNYKGRV
jgi:hypothetical protein